jgi:hypothetical protein
MRILEYTRCQTKVVAVEELRKKLKTLKPGDKDGRETLLRQIGEAYVKTPPMYDKANLLVHTDPVPDSYILPRGDSMKKGEKVAPAIPAVFGRVRSSAYRRITCSFLAGAMPVSRPTTVLASVGISN